MALTPLEVFRAELNERLVVHWTGGGWRVPLGGRHLAVAAADGGGLGRIVCGDGADAARALAGLRPGAGLDPARIDAALAPVAGLLTRIRALEGFPEDGWDPAHAARAPRPESRSGGPVALLSSAAVPVSELVGLLAGAAARGAVWKPAPRAAASAHLVMRALAPLAGASLALIQGDHATGRTLAGMAPPLWAARHPPALSDTARVRSRR